VHHGITTNRSSPYSARLNLVTSFPPP
jgi:hypothetical protein